MNKMRKSISTPQFRSALSQLCGIFPYYFLKFAEGTSLGFQIILLAELYKTDSEITMSIAQLTWLASLTFFTPAGALTTGLLTHRLGSRTMVIVAAAMYIASWLLFHYATSVSVTFVGRLLAALEAVNTVSVPHISEISEPQFRSRFLAINQMIKQCGSFFSLLLGSLVYWRTIALVNLVFPIVAVVTVLATPNSPTWLATKGRLSEAENALCWLRGWVEPISVQTEFRALAVSLHNSSPTSKDQESNVEAADCQTRPKHFFQLFLKRSFYLPLLTVCTVFLLYILTGAGAVHSYSAILFREINSPIDASIAVVIDGAMSIVGNFIIILFVRRTGKRKLVFFALVVIALCYASIAVVGFFELQNGYLWIPTIALVVASLANYSGAGTVVYMVVGEFFPSSVRYIGTSIGLSMYMTMMSVMVKSFLYVVEGITLPGTFLVFALMNVVALIGYYFLFPETEGRSLIEIEDHFKDVKNVKKPEK